MGLFGNVSTVELKVTGMHCPKCVVRVKEALESVDGVTKAEVLLEPGLAKVEGTADVEALIAAVKSIEFGAELA